MSLLGGFFRWWGRELAAASPALGGGRPRWALVAAPDPAAPTQLTLSLRARRRRRALGTLDALSARRRRNLTRDLRHGRIEIVLAAPAASVVTRMITLPLAAEAELERVISFEIDRLTPFNAAELFYTFEIARRRPEADKLDVELSFARRVDLSAPLDALSAAGFPAQRIDVIREAAVAGSGAAAEGTAADRDPDLRGVNLLPKPPALGWRFGQVALAAALTALALTGGTWTALTLAQQQARVDALQAAVDMARREARAAQAAAVGAGGAGDAARRAYERKTGAPAMVAMIARLTELLPDDAYLETLTLSADGLELSGRAADAAALIALFERDPVFRAPTFRAPITRDAEGRGERFSMSVGLGPARDGVR